MQTHYVQIVHDGRAFDADDWTPWKNCDNVHQTADLALHKFLREAGYASARAEYKPFEVSVYVAPADTERHANG